MHITYSILRVLSSYLDKFILLNNNFFQEDVHFKWKTNIHFLLAEFMVNKNTNCLDFRRNTREAVCILYTKYEYFV